MSTSRTANPVCLTAVSTSMAATTALTAMSIVPTTMSAGPPRKTISRTGAMKASFSARRRIHATRTARTPCGHRMSAAGTTESTTSITAWTSSRKSAWPSRTNRPGPMSSSTLCAIRTAIFSAPVPMRSVSSIPASLSMTTDASISFPATARAISSHCQGRPLPQSPHHQ